MARGVQRIPFQARSCCSSHRRTSSSSISSPPVSLYNAFPHGFAEAGSLFDQAQSGILHQMLGIHTGVADQLTLATPDGVACKISAAPMLKRFHGTVKVNPMALSSDVSKLSEAVIQHLSALLDSKVAITIDIAAYMPEGAPEQVVRTVMENCRTLKFHPLPQFEEA